MKISIFGLGYVGAVSGACLAELGHEVIGVDVSAHKIDMINRGEAPIVEQTIAELTSNAVGSGRLRATSDGANAVLSTQASLISVGTPTGRNGAPDISHVEQVVREIGAALRDNDHAHTVIIRSTVPPGATMGRLAPILAEAAGEKLGNRINIAFNPEFLREGKSVKDFKNPPFTIIGAISARAEKTVRDIYDGVNSEVIVTDPGAAESMKLLSNSWHALKVAFANESARILAGTGVDPRTALEIFARDRILNISPVYLKPGFAFGGSCLPKDLRALISLAEEARAEPALLRAVAISNDAHLFRAVDAVRACGRRPAVLFGLAFKPGTDDLRESPYVALAERLIGKGYELKIVDQFVDASQIMGKNKEFIEREIPHFVDLLTRDAEEAIDAADIIIFGHACGVDKGAIIERGVGKYIIDLSGDEDLARCGADYRGLAW